MKTKKESILGEAKKGEAKKSKFGDLFSRGKTDEGTIIIDEAPAEAVKPTTQTTAQSATTVQAKAKQPTATAAESAAKDAKPAAQSAATASTQPATAAQPKTATPAKQEAQATSSTSKSFRPPEVNPLATTKPAASQSTTTAQPAAKAAKPASTTSAKPATASAQPKSAPATPASDNREIISNGKAVDGFEPERAKTDIALMISRFTDEMNNFTSEISSKFDSYSEQLEKLSERVGKLEERASQSARPTVKQGNVSSEDDAVIKAYYFWDAVTRGYRVTTDIIAAIQLSQTDYQICYLVKEDGSYYWADEAEINEYLPDPPAEGIVKTYVFNGSDGKCHYHWNQAAAWQLSKSYNAPELNYQVQYWVWEGGVPVRKATSEELGARPMETAGALF